MKKFLLLFFLIFSPMLFAQTSTEAFETESAGSTSFTDNGVTFNIISHTSTFNIVNYPATGWSGTVNDNQYIDNTNNVGPASSSFSIKTTSNLFKVNRFWVYVADQFNNQNTIGTLTITGKLSGVTKFTQTKTNNFAISLGTTNGYTLIDLTNLNGQNYSNIVIDELQLTLGGNYYYLGLDAFTWVKDSNIVTTDSQSFITTWEVPNDNGSIKLYTDTNKYKYNYNVSWENIDDSDKKSKPLPNFKGDCVISNLPKGKYRVMITGDFPYFNVAKDFEDPNAKQLLTVEQWGTQLWKSMHKTFQSASNLIHIGKDIPNLTQVTDMSRMFDFAISFNGDLSKWDVSKVTDMQYIFSGASSFNGDLSKWNVSSLKNMQSMFHAAVAFDGDLSQWNVSSATNMIQVFAYAMSFNRDLSRWNVSNVTDMQSMFLGASSFNRDLSKWNVSKVIGPYGMLSMLEYSGMSVNNYDATLKGWANLSTVPSNVTLGATGLKYCTANTERDKLIKEKGWKINGDIKLGSEYILKDKSVVYDGKAHKLELELPHSFRGTYEIVDSSNNVVSDAINAGIYTVRAISECDQSVLHTATLTITPAVLTVTATPQSKVYGAVDSKLDYTISGLVNNDKEIDVLSGSLSRVAGENVGSYAITLGSLAANNNYILSFTGANLTIAPAVLIVSATAQSKIYGAVDPSLSYAVFGLIEGDLLSGSLSRVAGEDVGTYSSV
ncbi:BspA family leucine-rich repeat surface protein [Myroides profundi]|uniref:BspA family leucine-rich repeat surface protein n=1 Tax=Myroides profundi TaxID=480520 RepID=UPI0009E2C45F|nr:BspA family leucine-rich repeat surface protein [Myroides profundi]